MSELLRGRRFRVWDYCISHPTLLVRSFETDSEPNIDLFFRVVTYFEGPFALGEIELQEPTEAERARVRRTTDEGRFWAIQGTEGRALVAAADFGIGQNRWGVAAWRGFDPPGQPDGADVLEADIAPVDPRDRQALLEELAAIAAHPVYNHAVDLASGRIVLRSRGEAFDLVPWSMTREHRIEVRIGPPRVRYREALAHPVTVDETHKRHGPDGSAFARVILTLEPNLRETGASFERRIEDGAVPDAYLDGTAKGVWTALTSGPKGWPVVDVAVVLHDGAYHDADSSPEAFAVAAGAACRQAFHEAGTVLLEPMMRVEVTIPATYFAAVSGDLAERRGRVLDKGWSGTKIELVARVPLVNMLDYRNNLRVVTHDSGHHSMRFDGSQPSKRIE